MVCFDVTKAQRSRATKSWFSFRFLSFPQPHPPTFYFYHFLPTQHELLSPLPADRILPSYLLSKLAILTAEKHKQPISPPSLLLLLLPSLLALNLPPFRSLLITGRGSCQTRALALQPNSVPVEPCEGYTVQEGHRWREESGRRSAATDESRGRGDLRDLG